METEELTTKEVHHGNNIRRIRIEKNMNQEALSKLVNLSQSAVSKYELTKVIDDEMLQRFAHALDIPVKYLKGMEEDAQTVIFENNAVTNTNSDNSQQSTSKSESTVHLGFITSSYSSANEDNRVSHYNPIEKVSELYERLLKEKDEKYTALERRLQHIEQDLQYLQK